jgi:hypothetical protein
MYYEVICGNIGTVHTGYSHKEACEKFQTYVDASKAECGRAGGEDVTLFSGGEILREYIGSNTDESGETPWMLDDAPLDHSEHETA